jgi:hypothetical protein
MYVYIQLYCSFFQYFYAAVNPPVLFDFMNHLFEYLSNRDCSEPSTTGGVLFSAKEVLAVTLGFGYVHLLIAQCAA